MKPVTKSTPSNAAKIEAGSPARSISPELNPKPINPMYGGTLGHHSLAFRRNPPLQRYWRIKAVRYITYGYSARTIAIGRVVTSLVFCLTILAILSLFKIFTIIGTSCPSYVDLDLQLPCSPESLDYMDFPVSSVRELKESSQCLASPVQTPPQVLPCIKPIFKGAQNATCYRQKVIYQKWLVIEEVVITETPVGVSDELIFVSDMERVYFYTCRDAPNEELPSTSYKEPIELMERFKAVILPLAH